MQFNPDGSLKLPEHLMKAKQDNANRMKTQRCAHIIKEVVSDRSQKKCVLRITLSELINESTVRMAYTRFMEKSEVPSKLKKINEKEFEVEIGTCFRRCTDCSSLVRNFSELLDSNVIEEKRGCTFEQNSHFCYEDYF